MTKEDRISYWRKLVGKQDASGLSALAFCKEHHINPSRFYHWRIRFRKEKSKDRSADFFELVPLQKHPQSGIRLFLNDGLSIEVQRGFDPFTLRAVIETVRGEAGQPCLR